MCTDDTEGVLSENGEVCCPLGCNGQCGGTGCSSFGAASGLGGESCCVGEIMESGVTCGGGQEAPCIVTEEGNRGVVGTNWGDLARSIERVLSQQETDEPNVVYCVYSSEDTYEPAIDLSSDRLTQVRTDYGRHAPQETRCSLSRENENEQFAYSRRPPRYNSGTRP